MDIRLSYSFVLFAHTYVYPKCADIQYKKCRVDLLILGLGPYFSFCHCNPRSWFQWLRLENISFILVNIRVFVQIGFFGLVITCPGWSRNQPFIKVITSSNIRRWSFGQAMNIDSLNVYTRLRCLTPI